MNEQDKELKYLEDEMRLVKVGDSLGENINRGGQKENLFLIGDSKQGVSNSSNKSTINDD